MFYLPELLRRRIGNLSLLWALATNPKSVKCREVLSADVTQLATSLLRLIDDAEGQGCHMSLRLQSRLFYGLSELYKRKAEYSLDSFLKEKNVKHEIEQIEVERGAERDKERGQVIPIDERFDVEKPAAACAGEQVITDDWNWMVWTSSRPVSHIDKTIVDKAKVTLLEPPMPAQDVEPEPQRLIIPAVEKASDLLQGPGRRRSPRPRGTSGGPTSPAQPEVEESVEVPREARPSDLPTRLPSVEILAAAEVSLEHPSVEPTRQELAEVTAVEGPPALEEGISAEEQLYLAAAGKELEGVPPAEMLLPHASVGAVEAGELQLPYSPALEFQIPQLPSPRPEEARMEFPASRVKELRGSWKPSCEVVMQHITHAMELGTKVLRAKHGADYPEEDMISFSCLVPPDVFTRRTAAGWFATLLDLADAGLVHLTQLDPESSSMKLYGDIMIQKLI